MITKPAAQQLGRRTQRALVEDERRLRGLLQALSPAQARRRHFASVKLPCAAQACMKNVRDHAKSIEAAVAADGVTSVNFVGNNVPPIARQLRVGSGYFHVLGVSPLLCREFTRDEDQPGGPALGILSYDFWQQELADVRTCSVRRFSSTASPRLPLA